MKVILLCVTVLSTILLCGCDNQSNDNAITESDNETSSVESDAQDNDEGKVGISTYTNIYRIQRNETTGEAEYNYFIDDCITFDGNALEFGISVSVNTYDSRYETVDALVVMVVDGQLIPFELADEGEKLVHNITMNNGQERREIISFSAENIEKDEKKDWTLCVIPLLEEYRYVPDEIVVAYYNTAITSTVERQESSGSTYCTDGYYFDTSENVYGKSLYEISEYNGVVCDYILKDKNGNLSYMGDHDDGRLVTLLFCDGQLYNGFSESYGMITEGNSGEQVHRQIDTSGLSAGTHEMFAVALEYDEDGKLSGVYKSLTEEVLIDE